MPICDVEIPCTHNIANIPVVGKEVLVQVEHPVPVADGVIGVLECNIECLNLRVERGKAGTLLLRSSLKRSELFAQRLRLGLCVNKLSSKRITVRSHLGHLRLIGGKFTFEDLATSTGILKLVLKCGELMMKIFDLGPILLRGLLIFSGPNRRSYDIRSTAIVHRLSIGPVRCPRKYREPGARHTIALAATAISHPRDINLGLFASSWS